MPRTNFGNYLYSERIRRKVENLNEYLTERKIPISESYYRDLESGRKLLRVETAKILCQALDLDEKSFYYYLLKDLLPENTFNEIIKTPEKLAFESVSNEIERLTSNIMVLKKAYAKTKGEIEEPYDASRFEVDRSIVEFLDNNFELLPIIHFVYMRKECTFNDIKEIIKRNNINISFKIIIREFEKYKLVMIDKGKKIIRRHSRYFRIPRTMQGLIFKDRFFLHECDVSIKKRQMEFEAEHKTTSIQSLITSLTREGLFKIQDSITDLMAKLDAEESNLAEIGTQPFFISVVISPREEYDTKTPRKGGNKL